MDTSARILVADDHPATRRLTAGILESPGHQVVLANDGREALTELGRGNYDIAVLDWIMPRVDGVTLCRQLRQRSVDRYLYVMLVTAKGKADEVVAGLDAGADGYLVKLFHPEELRTRVRAGGRIVELERRMREANARLEALASTDALTGVRNRRAILWRLEEERSRSTRESQPFSVLLMDIDHSKQVNDMHGHTAGDGVLQELSGRLTTNIRPYDALGRTGGDEFLILLPGTAEQQALAIGERLRALIAEASFAVGTGDALRLTASFGVAQVHPNLPLQGFLSFADALLYRAKKQGGNSVVGRPLVYSPQ